jgi:hypothetical protein
VLILIDYREMAAADFPGRTDQNICPPGMEAVFIVRIGRKIARYRTHFKKCSI